MRYTHPEQIMQEIASLTPSFQGVTYAKIEQHGSIQWPCNANTVETGTALMHKVEFVRGKGKFFNTQYVATDEKVTRKFPLILTTGRVLSQYNVGAQTRRTENSQFYSEDRLESHPHDAAERGIGCERDHHGTLRLRYQLSRIQGVGGAGDAGGAALGVAAVLCQIQCGATGSGTRSGAGPGRAQRGRLG